MLYFFYGRESWKLVIQKDHAGCPVDNAQMGKERTIYTVGDHFSLMKISVNKWGK